MGAQFGHWNFDGALIPTGDVERVASLLAPFGPDGNSVFQQPGLSLVWSSFETTEEHVSTERVSNRPIRLESGEILMWNGRLDNGADVIRSASLPISAKTRDVEIIAAAWSRWGQSCLPRLVGDWALSVWSPHERSLYLAADILATRHLCYATGNDSVQWSSVPDPLILLPEGNLSLDEEYLAGWLAAFPAAHLTPFREIRRVPPASLVTIRPGGCTTRRYWDFDGHRRIRHAQDAEYEEEFLHLFAQSVRRRVRSHFPVLAELSGGIDSSSIVCMADRVASIYGSRQIDTVSFFSREEPNWNEEPFFAAVEAYRHRTGFHLDVSSAQAIGVDAAVLTFRPGARSRRSLVTEYMADKGYRVLLSGIGGDEFLGGVPTPLPELEDLLARGKILALWRRSLAWALVQQRPWMYLLGATAGGFLHPSLTGIHRQQQIPWLLPGFASRQRHALEGYRRRLRLTGPLPSFQENTDALEGIRRQLGCIDLSAGYPFERRYPFLDRDLLEFLFAIPREQQVRPGQRRSLMRRALRGIVPDAILDRRRKAFISRAPIRLADQHIRGAGASRRAAAEEAGIVDTAELLRALKLACSGGEVPLVSLLRTMDLEHWLRVTMHHGLLDRARLQARSDASANHSRGNQVVRDTDSGEATSCGF